MTHKHAVCEATRRDIAPCTVTLGADPELFMLNNDGTPLPIVGLLGGTKENPLPVDGLRGDDGIMLQEDNVMAEYNIAPATDARKFSYRISMGKQAVLNKVRLAKPQAKISTACSLVFANPSLESEQAQMFGCSPDYNAYMNGGVCAGIDKSKLLGADKSGAKGEWRFSGGHLHVGWDVRPDMPEWVMAMFLDAYAYLPYLEYDVQGQRRALYGQAGRFRPKSYGLEYRTPSNFWVHNADLSYSVATKFIRTAGALYSLDQGYLESAFKQVPWADVKRAIENEDHKAALGLNAYLRNDLPLY